MVVFWQGLHITEYSRDQWESLCDGCGKCCLHKLEDEDDERVYYTDVACRYLDTRTAACSDYPNRLRNVPGCLNLTPSKLLDCYWWLPPTCAYRRVAEGNDLPSWHPLRTGRRASVAEAGHSVQNRVVSESTVEESEWQERVIHWVTEDESQDAN